MDQIVTEKPTVPAYPGMRWIYHRLTVAKEYMHDMKVITFAAGEYKQMPEPIAIWLYEHHSVREHPERYDDPDFEVRVEAVEYAFALDDDPRHYGVPLYSNPNEEYLSRAGQAMYLGRGTDDLKTHPQLIRVGEVTTPPVPMTQGNGTTHPSAEVETLKAQVEALQRKLAAQADRRIGGRRPQRRKRAQTPVPVEASVDAG
jgi:hypothetical protein